MWKKWLWFSGMLLSLSVVGMTLVEAKPIDQPNVLASAEGVDSFNDQVILDLATPNYTISSADLSFGKFDRLTVPDQAYTDRAGYPQLPLKSFLVGAPADARVELVVLSDEVVLLSGTYRLSPAPKPAPLTADFQAGQMRDVINSSVYSANTLYPNQPASITQDAWLRDQRIIRVELYPFQVRTDRGELIWHRHLQVAVRFYRTTSLARAQSTNSWPSPFEYALQSTLVNYEEAKQWRAQPADQPISAQAQPALNQPTESASSLSTSPQIKIVVDHDGIYRVTYDDLISAGLVITGLNPDNFHLTSQEQDVAIYVSVQTAGVFAPGDFIEFYGQKFRGDVLAARYANESSQWMTYPNGWHAQFNATMLEKYTDDNVYWLNVDGPAGQRMAAIDGTPDGISPTPVYYTTTVHAEQSNIWWSWSFTSEDTWFWDDVQASVITTKTYTTSLSAIANVPQAAVVRGEIVARAENAVDSPDHRTQFWLNSEVAPFTDNSWDGLIRYHFEGYVPQPDLISGVNQLRMVLLPQPALPRDEIYFDWFEVQYARLFQASNDQILFSDAFVGARQYVITNFVTSTLKIYDVTNPLLPQRVLSATISGDGSNVSTTIGVSSTSPLTYYVIGADMIRTPKSVTTYTAPDLLSASNGADYIIIAPTAFLTASQTLANYRASQGMRVKIIDIADLYNMFNDGIYNPIAIKNFLAYAYSHWQPPAPAYAVLIGDGHWNFKNYGLYGDPTIYMPPFLAFVDPWQGEVDSTNLLAAFVGSDSLPDISIGRVPVNSIAELNTVISKTISYEQAGPQSYQTRSMFVADNWDQGGNFGQLSDDLIASNYPTYLLADRVYIDNFAAQGQCTIGYNGCRYGTGIITNTLNQSGTLFLVYGGHSTIHYWAAEMLMADTDIQQLTNLNHLSIVLDMTCLDGYWFGPPYDPNQPNKFGQSFMEQMMRAANGGAVATFSAGGLGLATGHNALTGGMLNAIFKGGVQRLGPASIAGKLNVYLSGGDGLDLINTYTVLGDPALRLPTYSISPWSRVVAKSGNPGTVVTYTLPVTNLANLQDQITVTLSGNAWSTNVAAPIALPQTTTNIVVSVTIPSLTLPGVTDVVSVTIASQGREAPNDYAVLTTTANAFYQFNLSTPVAAQSQLRNTVVSYTLLLTNSGNLTDVFLLNNSGNVWPSSLSTYTLTMQPFESADIIVSTTIPSSAMLTEMDVVTVTVNSKGSGLLQLQAFKTTVLAPYSILLPIVLRNK